MSIINGSPNIPSVIENNEVNTAQAINTLKTFLKNVNDNGVNKQYVDEVLRNLSILDIVESTTINNTARVCRVLLDASPITITLDGILPGTSIFIIDELGLSETYNITLDLNGDSANGSTSDIVIAKNYGFVELYCTSAGNFIIVREKLI